MENSPKKAVILLVLLLVLGFASIYGASYLFRLFVAIADAKIHGFSTFRLPELQSVGILSIFTADKIAHPDAFKWSLIIVGGVALFLFFGIASVLNPKKALYGSARFANNDEINKAGLWIDNHQVKKGGLFADNKIIVGKVGHRYLGLGGQLFAYLAAPTRSGKGVGVVIPVLLSYAHSIVVLDVKKELWNISAAFRRANGHQVYLFDPFNANGATAKWNPCSYIRREMSLREKDVKKISQSLLPHKGDGDPVWVDSARNLFNGLMLYLLDKEDFEKRQGNEFTPTIKEVYNLATGSDGEAAQQYFFQLTQASFISQQAKQTLTSVLSAADKTFASVLFTLNTALAPFADELVANAMQANDFDLRQVRQSKMTIYLGIDAGDLEQAAPLVNLFYTQLIDLNTRTLPQDDATLQYQCLLLMDEATAPGRIEILKKAVSYMAGFNVRMLMIVQSPAQLRDKELYGIDGTKNILSNCALKIMYTPNDVDDAEEYSKLLGTTTVKERTSKSFGKSGTSDTQTQNSRRLMLAQELLAMPSQQVIIRLDGMPYAIKAEKNCYYQDKHFLHFKKYGRLVVKKNRQNNLSGSLNLTQKPIQSYFEEIQQHYPNEFQGLFYKKHHFVSQNCLETFQETVMKGSQ